MLLAAFNAIAGFLMHAEPQHQGPVMQGPAEVTAPAAAPKGRKPKGGNSQAHPEQPQQGEPELFPHAHQQQQPGAPTASFGQPVPGGTLGAAPDIKSRLHSELSNFSVVCGPMALQGLLAYFGAQRSSELPMDRAEEIFGYIRAARAQMQQGQNV